MRKKKLLLWFIIILVISSGLYIFRDSLPVPVLNSYRVISSESVYSEDIDSNAVIEVKRGNIKKTVSTSGYIKTS